MKKLNLFIAALLTVLLMQYTVTQSQTYLIDKDTLAGFNRHECDTILTYLYQWSMLSEQVNSLSHQLAFDSTTISRQAIEVDIQKKINKSLIAFSHVLLNDHTVETLTTFERDIVKFPEVMECFQMTGAFDFILRVATKDMEEYHHFYRKLGALPRITSVQSFFVLSETKSDTAYPL